MRPPVTRWNLPEISFAATGRASSRGRPRSARMTDDRAQVVVIGGGITGVSVAYHLARAGMDATCCCSRRAS